MIKKIENNLITSGSLEVMNKKGSHISIILSIVMFVGFLVFIYALLGPAIEFQKNRQLAIDHLNKKIIERASSNLTTVTFLVSDTYTYDPLHLGNCIELSHLTDFENLNYSVKDENNMYIDSFTSGTKFEIPWDGVNTDFLKIFYTNETLIENTRTDADCDPLILPTDYTIEYNNTDEKIFETKIGDLLLIYDLDYNDFKQSLDIPFETEFGFNFTYGNGTSIGTPANTLAPEIYVQDFTVEYVDIEANINPGTLSIIIW